MWEHGAADSLFALLFGVELECASRNWSRIRRASFANGCLLTASVLLLCLFGETLLPPLAALRQCCGERSWIIGKLLLGLLAMPARMMGLLAVWLVLAALLGIAGGRLVRRRAEHSLRRRM